MNRITLSSDDVSRAAKLFSSYCHLVQLELSGRTADEIYELSFSRLLKPNWTRVLNSPREAQEPTDTILMFGTDQRDRLVPVLKNEARYLREGARIFDLGCGDGQTSRYLVAAINESFEIGILDPNVAYLDQYEALIRGLNPKVQIGQRIPQTIDDFLAMYESGAIGLAPQNLILLVHSLYFASDLARLLSAVVELLATGGRAFIVFADERRGFTGTLIRQYVAATKASDKYLKDVEGRHQMFGFGDAQPSLVVAQDSLRSRLGREDFEIVFCERQPTRIFGDDIGDIFACAFLTGLSGISTPATSEKIEFVAQELLHNSMAYDLAIETSGPRIGMLSVAQPQFVTILQKS